MRGKICKDGFKFNIYDVNEKLLESFDLKHDKSTGKDGVLTSTCTKGSKSLKVELQEVNIKYNLLKTVQLFGKFVNQAAEDLNFAEDIIWSDMPLPIYAEGNPFTPTQEAREAMGMGRFVTDYGICYLLLQQTRMGMGAGNSHDYTFQALPESGTPTFMVISAVGGYYTENMNSDNPTEVNTSAIEIYIYQYKDGEMVNVTDKVSPIELVFEDYNSFLSGFNILQIETTDKTKIKLAWGGGKIVKK